MTISGRARTVLRLACAATLIGTGAIRVLGHEGWSPTPELLSRTWGQISPCEMFRLWLSVPALVVAFFGGGALTAGLLCLTPRTATLGALLGGALALNETVAAALYCGARAALWPSIVLTLAVAWLVRDRRRFARAFAPDPSARAPSCS